MNIDVSHFTWSLHVLERCVVAQGCCCYIAESDLVKTGRDSGVGPKKIAQGCVGRYVDLVLNEALAIEEKIKHPLFQVSTLI